MNKDEVKEVRSIIKGRFKLLRKGIGQREREARAAIRERVEAEYQAVLADATAEGEALVARAKGLQAEAEEIQKIYAARGVMPGVAREQMYYHRQKGEGSYVRTHTYEKTLVDTSTHDTWVPMDLEKRVDRELRDLLDAAASGIARLDEQEVMLLETLAMDGVGEDGRAFLEQVPTLDTLIPMPRGVEQLQETNGGV